MLIEISKVRGLPTGAIDEGALIGTVKQAVVSPEAARVIGFLVKIKGLFRGQKVISFQDVVDIDTQGLVINSRDNLVSENEIVRIKELVDSRFSLIGLSARTKNKKYLGRVSDAVIESTSGDIIRVYVKYFWDERIFERSMIHEIKKDEIILTFDDKKKVKKKQAVMAAEKVVEAA